MQGMRDLLRGSLARSLRMLSEEDRLASALPVVCGQALAAHCEVDRLDEQRTLHLRVSGREWLAPLLSMRDVLQHDLARIAGVKLDGLHFESGRVGGAGFRSAELSAAGQKDARSTERRSPRGTGSSAAAPSATRPEKTDGRRSY